MQRPRLVCMQDRACARHLTAAIEAACLVESRAPVLQRQFLFNVINHPGVNFTGGPPSKISPHTGIRQRKLPIAST